MLNSLLDAVDFGLTLYGVCGNFPEVMLIHCLENTVSKVSVPGCMLGLV